MPQSSLRPTDARSFLFNESRASPEWRYREDTPPRWWSMKRRIFLALFAAAAFWPRRMAAQAAETPSPLVSVSWLRSHLACRNLVVIDIRSAADSNTSEDFSKGHIPGAIHSDFATAGWRTARGDLPLMPPSARQIEALIGGLGIDETSNVVVVSAGTDVNDFGAAARVYWTLKISGLKSVSILDGGFAAWRATPENPVETTVRDPSPTIFSVTLDGAMLVGSGEIESIVRSGNAILIDARPANYYLGRDKVPVVRMSGHIPGALNIDSAVFYDAKRNRLKPVSELARIAARLPRGPIVTYCNSGHWSATEWFVFSELLHRSDVRLYSGSMIEWTADPRHQVDSRP